MQIMTEEGTTQNSILQKNWIRWASTVIVLALMIAIFVLSAEVSVQSEGRSFPIGDAVKESGILDAYKTAIEGSGKDYTHFIQVLVRKLSHLLIYLALGGALFICYESWLGEQRMNWLWSMIIGIIYAATDEWHQSTVPGRSGSVEDVLIDAAGVVAGVLVVLGIVWLIKRRVKKRKNVGEMA